MGASRAARFDRRNGSNRRDGSARPARSNGSARSCWTDRCHRRARNAGCHRRDWRDGSARSARSNRPARSPNRVRRNVVEQQHLQHGQRRFLQWLGIHLARQFEHEQSAEFLADTVVAPGATRFDWRNRHERSSRSARHTRPDRRAGPCWFDRGHRCSGRNRRNRSYRRNGTARSARRDGSSRSADRLWRNLVKQQLLQHGHRRFL